MANPRRPVKVSFCSGKDREKEELEAGRPSGKQQRSLALTCWLRKGALAVLRGMCAGRKARQLGHTLAPSPPPKSLG